MWFGEPHPFPERGSSTGLSASGKQSYEGWSCRSYRGNQNTPCMFNNVFLNRAPCEIKWKNVVEPDWPHMVIWCMRILCWITVTTDTHSEYVMLIGFPLQHYCRDAPLWYVIRTLPVAVYFRDWPTTWHSEIYKQHVGNSIVFVIPLMLHASLCLCNICRACTIESTGKRDVTSPTRHGRI